MTENSGKTGLLPRKWLLWGRCADALAVAVNGVLANGYGPSCIPLDIPSYSRYYPLWPSTQATAIGGRES